MAKTEEFVDRGWERWCRVTTESYYIVRLTSILRGTSHVYLEDRNRHRFSRTRAKWCIDYNDSNAHKFDSKADAKKAIKCKAVQERLDGSKWSDGIPKDIVEIVKIIETTETKHSKICIVEERPKCEPLLALAIEAAQADEITRLDDKAVKDFQERSARRLERAKSK